MQTQEAIKTFLLKKKSNTKLDIFLFLGASIILCK